MTGVTTALLAVAAFATATLSGILGMGGGITLLGVMTVLLPAASVVPLHGAVQLCSNFSRTVVFLPHVRWRIFAVFSPFLLLGVWGAVQLWSGDRMGWFKPFIGVFLLLFLARRRFAPRLRRPPLWVYPFVGLASGFLTIFVGATGPFIAPFFLRDDMVKEEVVATKAICQAVGHALKIPAFMVLGFRFQDHLGPLLLLLAVSVGGTLTGKYLLSRIKEETFVRVFVVVLCALAIHLIASSVLS